MHASLVYDSPELPRSTRPTFARFHLAAIAAFLAALSLAALLGR